MIRADVVKVFAFAKARRKGVKKIKEKIRIKQNLHSGTTASRKSLPSFWEGLGMSNTLYLWNIREEKSEKKKRKNKNKTKSTLRYNNITKKSPFLLGRAGDGHYTILMKYKRGKEVRKGKTRIKQNPHSGSTASQKNLPSFWEGLGMGRMKKYASIKKRLYKPLFTLKI